MLRRHPAPVIPDPLTAAIRTDRLGHVDPAEVLAVVTDLSWLDDCICGQLPLREFFVSAGQTLSPTARAIARTCPTRRQEVILAYGRDLRWGYFGALSPGQRSRLTMEEALALVAADSQAAQGSPTTTRTPAA